MTLGEKRILTYAIVILLVLLFYHSGMITEIAEIQSLAASTILLLASVIAVRVMFQIHLRILTGETYTTKDIQPAFLIMLILTAVAFILIVLVRGYNPALSITMNWLYRLFFAAYMTVIIITLYKYG